MRMQSLVLALTRVIFNTNERELLKMQRRGSFLDLQHGSRTDEVEKLLYASDSAVDEPAVDEQLLQKIA